MYCDHYVYWKDDGKVVDPKIPESQRWIYNGTDCVRTREVGEQSARTITAYGMEDVDAFQQKFFWPVLQCMQRGVKIDKQRRAELRGELGDVAAADGQRPVGLHRCVGRQQPQGHRVHMRSGASMPMRTVWPLIVRLTIM